LAGSYLLLWSGGGLTSGDEGNRKGEKGGSLDHHFDALSWVKL